MKHSARMPIDLEAASAMNYGRGRDDLERLAGQLRLQTLTRLRWLAVIGQTAAVLAVYFGLGWPLPFAYCMAAIGISAWLNIFLTMRHRTIRRLTDDQASWLLAYDILQLAILFYFTGGLQNPFAFLFLVPVAVSASALPLERTILLGLLSLLAATILAFEHMPLPWDPASPLQLPPLYVAGMWVAVLCGTVFTAIFAWRISDETRQMSSALSATEMALAREQQLSALDGLAAAAAHELGTPLATITLVAKEMQREMPAGSAYSEDLELLSSQAGRCREILSKLVQLDQPGDQMFAQVQVTEMLQELSEPLRASGINITVSGAATSDEQWPGTREPVVARSSGILFSLTNLIENAVDFASTNVHIEAIWSSSQLSITCFDDGPGFSQDIIDRLGEPFVTTRRGYTDPSAPAEGGQEGMGLGFFIAKTLLERSGGWVTLSNQRKPAHGAIVQVSWPRAEIDVDWGVIE